MKFLALLFISSAALAEPGETQRKSLAHECQRGFLQSCYALQQYNAINPPTKTEGSSYTRQRYWDECRRGFQSSCDALRGLSGMSPAPPNPDRANEGYYDQRPVIEHTSCGFAPDGTRYCYTYR